MWHVYANTLEPVDCTMLALARYIISHQSVITGKAIYLKDTPNMNDSTKYSMKLYEIIDMNFISLVISVGDFGKNPIRKGAVTFVPKGCTVSPPMA